MAGSLECGTPTLASALFALVPGKVQYHATLETRLGNLPYFAWIEEVAAPATIIARSMVRTSPRKEAWPIMSLSSMPRKASH